jgi:hypothetical protein
VSCEESAGALRLWSVVNFSQLYKSRRDTRRPGLNWAKANTSLACVKLTPPVFESCVRKADTKL